MNGEISLSGKDASLALACIEELQDATYWHSSCSDLPVTKTPQAKKLIAGLLEAFYAAGVEVREIPYQDVFPNGSTG